MEMIMATYYGTAGPNIINASDLADTVFAYGGDDEVRGNAGNDTIHGHEGNDLLYGGADFDKIYGGVGGDTIYGGLDGDELYGGDGNDIIHVGGGRGTEGTDIAYGGAGDDILDVGPGWYGSNDIDPLQIFHGGSGNDQISGGRGSDHLYGGNHNDTLNGGQDGDELTGGAGADILIGGAGADQFFFGVADSGTVASGQADVIHDLEAADQIWLQGSYTFAGEDMTPGENQYSVWFDSKEGAWTLRWNAANDAGFHDIIVSGENPVGDISFFV
jgi:Ca2+-binding RTX toxin-like protein